MSFIEEAGEKRYKIYYKERIKKRSDILRFFNKDDSNILVYSNYFYTVFVLKNNRSYSRFAVSIKKNKAKAVYRNKVKRIVREIYRTEKENIKIGYDYFIIINRYTHRSFENWKKDLIKLFQRV